MSIEQLGSIGEFVGSIVVFITLLYLAIQVRQTRNAVIAQSSRDLYLSSSTWHLEMARNAELKRIAIKGQQAELQDYSEEEWYEFRMVALSLMLQMEAVFAQRTLGVEHFELADTWLRATKSLIESFPAYRKFWETAKSEGNLEPGFIEAVEAIEGGSDMRKVLFEVADGEQSGT